MDNNEKSTLPKTPDEVRAFLVQQRIKLGISQRQVSDIAKFRNACTISRIETGTQAVSRNKLSQIASAYQVPEDTLKLLVSSSKRGRKIGGMKITGLEEHTDILPLIKALAASDRENILASEMRTLIDGFVNMHASMQGLSTETQQVLLKALLAPAAKTAE